MRAGFWRKQSPPTYILVTVTEADFVSQGHCGPATELWIVAGSLNIVTDVIVLVLPMPYLVKLEMKMYKKVTLMITFGMFNVCCPMGAITCFTRRLADPG
jgi:hypothetical protein